MQHGLKVCGGDMNKNCPNCAAPYDIYSNVCPYCGTRYIDVSCIDFDNREPMFLKLHINNTDVIFHCVPTIGNVTISSEPVYVTNASGRPMIAVNRSNTVLDISFESI